MYISICIVHCAYILEILLQAVNTAEVSEKDLETIKDYLLTINEH